MMKKILLVISVLLSFLAVRAQKEKIILTLQKGETHLLRIEYKMSLNIPKGDKQVKKEGVIVYLMNFKVRGIQDTIYDVEMKFDSLYAKGSIFASSSNSDDINLNAILAKSMGSFIGKPCSLKITTTAKVKVSNTDSLASLKLPFTGKLIDQI